MTREEELDWLCRLRSEIYVYMPKEWLIPMNDALDMAIQALSQEPCENAIDREYLFKVLDDFCGHDRTATITLDTLADLVYDMPSVTQKSGKWIMSDDGLYRPICDKCGAHPWKGYIPSVEEATEVFKFCPNCGAKMVEPQESEE